MAESDLKRVEEAEWWSKQRSSLMRMQMGVMKRLCKMAPIGTPDEEKAVTLRHLLETLAETERVVAAVGAKLAGKPQEEEASHVLHT